MGKKEDMSGLNRNEDLYQVEGEAGEQYPDDTIGSLMAKCEELMQQIDDEKDRMERFMLETGGESDVSDRMQRNIDCLQDTLLAAENRLQMLEDAQEMEAFAPEKKATEVHKDATVRESVKKRLTEKKLEVATEKAGKKEKERKSPGMDMEK